MFSVDSGEIVFRVRRGRSRRESESCPSRGPEPRSAQSHVGDGSCSLLDRKVPAENTACVGCMRQSVRPGQWAPGRKPGRRGVGGGTRAGSGLGAREFGVLGRHGRDSPRRSAPGRCALRASARGRYSTGWPRLGGVGAVRTPVLPQFPQGPVYAWSVALSGETNGIVRDRGWGPGGPHCR